ncbi:class I adenylate-forming enzyme family protein [Mycolicibacter hiberniae]|uniref:AMP-binding protein n=1 Tax=Mycolicibacter hiberniae TaxID=29314 RepID=A0A7I7X6X9_9MYCO|nr:class I adenylate-forming enzyme family protein [Mycolicibacter hiberniae]MCV7084531.1 acyl--CoA ligase [Mycolicibacter hiberniae]ORV66475.1 AMP-binding protein [Mycolicibacter hiberniae]BBZ24401.1 AMP-binding protein [Mycolicibacter hiberniae]
MLAETLPALLRAQARARGAHPLLICDSDRISYADAEQRSAALARRLLALGAGPGSHIGLLYPNGTAFVIGLLAAGRIGAVVVPFATLAATAELRVQLVHSDVSMLLAAPSYRSHDYRAQLTEILADVDLDGGAALLSSNVPQLRHVLFDAEHSSAAGDQDAATSLRALEDAVAGADQLAIVYTSGSTGAPKGAVHTHAGLIGHQRDLNAIRRLTAEDTLFCNSPFFWIGGFAFALLATMIAGATLLCSNATDPGLTLDLLEAEKPTMANGFLSGIAALAQHPSLPSRDLSSLRRGNLYPLMPPDARPCDPELRHGMLGMTESGGPILVSGDDSVQPEHRRGSFGKPAPGFECRVHDGELWVRGRYMMQRYHKRSREECFDADGWFHTGDLVRTDADGFYYYLGRRDRMIKTAGASVFPAEVERAIAKVTGGSVAHVFGVPDPDRGHLVAAVIVADDVDQAHLRARLAAELASFKIPRRITAVPAARIPLRPGGKVDLRRLAEFLDD